MIAAEHGETRVLTAEMSWEPLSALSPGDSLITADLTPQDARYRLYRVDELTTIERSESPTISVDTTDGCLDVTREQEFLVQKWKKTMRRKAANLDAGDEIYWFSTPQTFETTTSYKRGYIHGAFAGDGSIPGFKDRVSLQDDPQNSSVYVSSTDKEIADTVVEFADSVAPEYHLTLKERTYNKAGNKAIMPVAPGHAAERIRADITDYPTDDPDYARGWLAGMFDTDGSFPTGKQLTIAQYSGPIRDHVCEYLDQLGYEWSLDSGVKGDYSGVIRLTPGRGTGIVYDFLTEIRPKVARKRLAFAGEKRIGGRTTITAIDDSPTDTQTVYDIETNHGTAIVNGMIAVSQP
jgi:hypothetical protein